MIEHKDSDDLLCFGIFKKDRLRNIWFIFPTVRFEESINKYVSARRLYRLEIINAIPKTIKKIYENRKKFVILEELSFSDSLKFEEIKNVENMFSSKSDFPRLRKFEFFSMEEGFKNISLWENAACFWNRLKILYFITLRTDQEIRTKLFESLTNLKSLVLSFKTHHYEIKLTQPVGKIIANLPYLENLCLEGCGDLVLNIGSKLRRFTADYCQPSLIKHVIISSPNIRSLNIKGSSSVIPWIFESIQNPISKLEKLRIRFDYSLEHTGEKDPIMKLECGKLTELVLSGFNQKEAIPYMNFILESEFPALKALKIRNVNISVTDQNSNYWLFFDHLEILVFQYLDSTDICDYLFSENEFSDLKFFELRNNNNIFEGKGYSEFPNVQTIKIIGEKIYDSFFEEQEFKNLVKLKISDVEVLKGTDITEYKEFPKLRVLKIDWCKNLVDDFFRNCDFPRLVTLTIVDCRFLTGEKWNDFEMLKFLEIVRCPLFGGWIFENQCVENLEFLHITNESTTKVGVGQWYTPKLKDIYIGTGTITTNEFCTRMKKKGCIVHLPKKRK